MTRESYFQVYFDSGLSRKDEMSPNKLSYLKAKEVIALANHLTKGSIDTTMSKPDLETYISARFAERTIADALRVLRSQGLVVPSMDESNAVALGETRECLKLTALPGLYKPDGSAQMGNCELLQFHEGPCRPGDSAMKQALKSAIIAKGMKFKALIQTGGIMPPGAVDSPLRWEPLSQKSQSASESIADSVNGLLTKIDATDPDTKEKFVTEPFLGKALTGQLELLKKKTLELFDEEFSDRAVKIGEIIDEQRKLLSQQIDERMSGLKIEAGSPIINTVSIILPEKPDLEKKMARRPHAAFMKILCLVRAGLIPLMVGPAGSGKTTIAEDLAEALELPYHFQSCTAGMSEGAITGRLLPLGVGGAMRYVSSDFVCGWSGEKNVVGEDGLITVVPDDDSAGICHLDEVDAADANTTLIFNAAFGNKKMTIETRAASGLGVLVVKHKRSIVTMAANTFGTGMDVQYQGRGALDAAFLDRAYPVMINYDPVLEAGIAGLPPPNIPVWQHAKPPSIPEFQDLMKWCHRVREAVEKAGVKKVWGTRALLKAKAARYGGIPTLEVKRDLLLGWPADLTKKMLEL